MKLSRMALLIPLFLVVFASTPYPANRNPAHTGEGARLHIDHPRVSEHFTDTLRFFGTGVLGFGNAAEYLTISPSQLALHNHICEEPLPVIIAEFPENGGNGSFGHYRSVKTHATDTHLAWGIRADSIRSILQIDHYLLPGIPDTLYTASKGKVMIERQSLCVDINEKVEYYHASLHTWVTTFQNIQRHEWTLPFPVDRIEGGGLSGCDTIKTTPYDRGAGKQKSYGCALPEVKTV